ncbi:hypothetical protein B7P43_G07620 [Cryptotermes secundus]|uniref:VPS9 domain-containing protein n=1 Tax=Cryptotermes secundus TaxID=105785 RepID=A0A2J7RLE4_9NEOP|nr:hypothetical protein B7P43_G07620 [Cryptotermes secundus]
MAISVRLPAGKGPYIEHYLIQAVDGELSLESSDNRFSNIPSLIAHYSQCCDELPVQLTLPRAMREAKNHQQLSSLALLGQEFWRYPMANPRPPEQQNQQHSETSSSQQRVAVGESLQSPPSSGSSLSSLGSGNNNHNSGHDIAARTPSSELGGGSGIGDAIVLNLAPLSSTEHSQQPQSLMSTFKGSGASSSCDVIGSPSSPTSSSVVPGVGSAIVVTTASTSSSIAATALVRGPRPTPPNTLNLMCSASSHTSSLAASGMRSASNSPAQLVSPPSTNSTNGDGSRAGPLVLSGGGGGGKTPPPPPPRWAKPTTLTSAALPGQNFTVTTTVTFSVNHNTTPPPHVEVSCVQVTPKRPQMESDGLQTMSSHCSSASTLEQCGVRLHQVMSPTTPSDISKLPGNGRGKKHRPSHGRQTTIKESHHYQESDILESPTVYYRSSVADKVSDYEDIWGPEMLSTFKPPHPFPRSSPFSSPEDISTSSGGNKKTPDLLERITTPVSGSCISLNSANGNLKDQQQRNRLGLVINTGSCTNSVTNSPMSPLGTETKQQSEEPGSMTPKNTKQGSPFYAEPADALRQAALVPRRRPRPGGQQIFQQQTRNHRHSDPASFQQWPVLPHHTGQLERIDSNDELTATPLSSSVDNLALLKPSRNGATSQQNINRPRGKPVQPPRIRPKNMRGKCFNDTSWAVDSSWEFIGNEDDGEDSEHGEGGLEERERRFPTLEQQENSLGVGDGMSSGGRKITVQDLIAQRFPSLRLSPEILSPNVLPGISSPLDSRMSSYDNVEGRNGGSHDIIASSNHNHHNVTLHHNHPSSNHHCASQISDNEDTQTVFSEPWDSSRWENLLHPDHTETNLSLGSNSVVQVMGQTPLLGPEEDDTMCGTNTNRIHSNHMVNGCTSNNGHISRTKSFKERLDPLLSPPRLQALRNRDLGGTGASIRAYALHLAADKSTTFAQNIDNFIACTRDSRETNPQVVMRNMRQFMSGMKNYLVKHGEREFEKEVEKERVKLKSTEFLNLDAILESVMHKLVVRPLKEHLYQLFVEEYTRTGAIQLLADNIQYARTKPMHELGVRARIAPPSEEALETICHLLTKLQEVDSPLDKLESLLACIGTIFNSVKSANQRCVALGADDFLPLFVWVLVQSGMLAAEIEADYMWGLLHPSLLSGEGGYYLTTLSSAVHVLKNFRLCSEEQSKTLGPGASLDVSN